MREALAESLRRTSGWLAMQQLAGILSRGRDDKEERATVDVVASLSQWRVYHMSRTRRGSRIATCI
jgi:hypothetical protein